MQAQGNRADGDLTVGVVVAGGRSRRFGGSVPKQYLDLAGRSVLERSVACLAGHPDVDGVVVVLPSADVGTERAEGLRGLPGVVAVVAGGDRRSDSVRAGLAAAARASIVLIHDAARPTLPPEVVDRVLAAARERGAAVPVVPVRDSVKRVATDRTVEATVGRPGLAGAQTPQGARRQWLLEALERAAAEGRDVEDEAEALVAAGRAVAVVDGDPRNVKITTPDDLRAARRRLEGGETVQRIGHGFDIHRFARDGRTLVLGGVRFEGERGLEGHSDADVVLHAAMDAVLGAAGLPDIGQQFPDDDARFEGASSGELAVRVAGLMREAGWGLRSLDLTVLAEAPRIGPRRDAMRRAIGSCFGVEPGRVGLKATTLEGLGALGRREGIACHAVALLGGAGDAD